MNLRRIGIAGVVAPLVVALATGLAIQSLDVGPFLGYAHGLVMFAVGILGFRTIVGVITPTVHLSHETSQNPSADDRIPGGRERTEGGETYVDDPRPLLFGAGSTVLAVAILAI